MLSFKTAAKGNFKSLGSSDLKARESGFPTKKLVLWKRRGRGMQQDSDLGGDRGARP